jgi:hypothetical protein
VVAAFSDQRRTRHDRKADRIPAPQGNRLIVGKLEQA